MNILQVIPYFNSSAGGPPVVVDRWAREFSALGLNSSVISTTSLAEKESAPTIDDHGIPYDIEYVDFSSNAPFMSSAQVKHALAQAISRADVVHFHTLWNHPNQLGKKLCKELGKPFVVSPHGMLDPHSFKRKYLKKKVYGELFEFPFLRQASRIIYTHQHEESLARSTCSRLPTGEIVSLGVDPPPKSREELTRDFLQRFPQYREHQRIVFLGRLHAKKGLDLVIQSANHLRNESNLKILLIGPGEKKFLHDLKQQVYSHNLNHLIELLPGQYGVHKWEALAAGDAFLLPSYQENFAIALVEALRIGTPALISKRINIWEDLQAANAIELCELDSISIAEKIQFILHNPERLSEMSHAARNMAAANYCWNASATKVANIYRQLIELGTQN